MAVDKARDQALPVMETWHFCQFSQHNGNASLIPISP
jgi:hypothetical protein